MSTNLATQLQMLPEALAAHLVISVVSLLLGVAISVPLGLIAVRYRRVRGPLLAVVGLIQTVPGLALLALMVPILVAVGDVLEPLVAVPALGMLPVLIALTLYAMLPVLRNTVAGIEGVDPALIEAAHAIGMTDRQVLRFVQVPLAAPVMLAGVRTAAVWVVGMATLATPVGQTSLGNFIFAGLQTRNVVAVLVGCAGAAGLALWMDAALAVIERAVARRRPAWAVGAGVALALSVAVGVALPRWSAPPSDRPVVVVGSKPFTEQYVLASLIESLLVDHGVAVQRRDSLGSSIALDGLLAGELDVYVDYSGTLWANHLGRTEVASGPVVLEAVCARLRSDGVDCLGPVGFENAYALAVREADAVDHGWSSLEDLSADAAGRAVGADIEFFQRPEWAAVRQAYGLDFARERTFDSTFLYEAASAEEVDAIVAYTSDGRVAAHHLRVLTDPRGALPPYDAVLLLGPDAPSVVATALAPLVGSVDVAAMREANRRVDVDGATPQQAAAWLRTQLSPRTPAP